MTKFKEIRQYGTPGINADEQSLMKGEVVNGLTDTMGIIKTYEFLEKYLKK